MNKKGFTLIELMIVVAIIGILSAIALPRFADLIRKSHEGATRGNLSSLRSALSIYYSEQEGLYPLATDSATFAAVMTPRFLKAIPNCNVALPGIVPTSVVTIRNVAYTPAGNTAQWGYAPLPPAAGIAVTPLAGTAVVRTIGEIWIDNGATDSRNTNWINH